mmetsp:Transcript_39625/g.92620  ORF Transcript_39625/g.92620 Transcript_39625/m.92620 type:complete len:298 (-) Transcript_39625:106-999(-)
MASTRRLTSATCTSAPRRCRLSSNGAASSERNRPSAGTRASSTALRASAGRPAALQASPTRASSGRTGSRSSAASSRSRSSAEGTTTLSRSSPSVAAGRLSPCTRRFSTRAPSASAIGCERECFGTTRPPTTSRPTGCSLFRWISPPRSSTRPAACTSAGTWSSSTSSCGRYGRRSPSRRRSSACSSCQLSCVATTKRGTHSRQAGHVAPLVVPTAGSSRFATAPSTTSSKWRPSRPSRTFASTLSCATRARPKRSSAPSRTRLSPTPTSRRTAPTALSTTRSSGCAETLLRRRYSM